jgi:hypothetical protein
MLNWPLHGNDWHQGLSAAFDAGAAAHGELLAAMRAHSQALLEGLIEATDGWFQPGQAFPLAEAPLAGGRLRGPGSLALMPYWREGRRLVGLEVVIEQQLLPGALARRSRICQSMPAARSAPSPSATTPTTTTIRGRTGPWPEKLPLGWPLEWHPPLHPLWRPGQRGSGEPAGGG